MGSLVYTLVSMVQVASLHCSMRPEISPCSCTPHESFNNTIYVTCEGLASFNQVFDSLKNKFSNKDNIWLKITKSQLDDLETRNFKDMNMNITRLILNYDDLRTLPESSFRNLSHLGYFSLSDNHLEEIPRHIFSHMPKIVTMDLGYGRIKTILADDFRNLSDIRFLILVNNNIRHIEKESIPKTVRFLHLGRNNLTSLNGTLRDIENMDVLFLNENNLTTLDDELPIKSVNFKTLIAHHNQLENLTQDLTKFMYLDAMYLSDNKLKRLDGIFQNASYIQTLSVHNNKIEYLAEDEFETTIELQELDLGNNFIRSINNSLLPLKKVRICNISRNHLIEFSLNEVRGLRELQVIDLSYNYIEKLTGHLENVVDQDLYFVELRLDHNLLKTLDGALMNLNRLRTLDISFNKLKWIAPDDLIGLDDLEQLDVSHNYLQTLEDTAMAFLPKLEKLYCSYNNLSKLERDFNGLPALCFADLSNNRITHISPELVVKTRCNSHGVINKLEILLQENPILCMDELSKLFAQMEAQETRLLGIAHCIVPKEEPTIESIFVPPPSLPSSNTKDLIEPVVFPEPVPALIVPIEMPIILPSKPEENLTFEKPTNERFVENEPISIIVPDEVPSKIIATLTKTVIADIPITEIIITSTDSTSLNPDENNVDIITPAERLAHTTNLPISIVQPTPAVVVATAMTEENDTIINTINYINKLENVTVLQSASTKPTIPPQTQSMEAPIAIVTSAPSSIAEIVLGEMDAVSKNPEADNYIYETFSQISPVDIGEVSSTLQRNEHLVIEDEPPEIPNDAVPAA